MLDETIFNKSHIIGIDEVVKGVANHSPKIREISFRDFMLEFNNEFHSFMECEEFSVVWENIDGEIHINEIYNQDTGCSYWRRPAYDSDWDENDDVIVSSLLMFGELEQQIGVVI